MLVELADLVFAVDSVPAIFAITTDAYIVYTSNIFAILGLRALYFGLAAVINRFAYVKQALAILLIFIGSKIFVADLLGWTKFPAEWTLAVTFGEPFAQAEWLLLVLIAFLAPFGLLVAGYRISVLLPLLAAPLITPLWGTVSGFEERRELLLHAVAEVVVTGEQKEAASRGFRLLASYIFCGNKKRQDIAMTAPMTQERSSEKIAMTAPVAQRPAGERPPAPLTIAAFL